MDLSGLPNSDTSEARAMEMVGNAMAQPQFQPENFWAMAFSPQYEDVARAATNGGDFPFMPGDSMTKQGAPLGNFTNNGGDGTSAVSGMPSMSGDPRMQPTPLVDALKVQGSMPPWLWNDASANGIFGSTPTNTPVATGSSGSGQPLGPGAVSRAFSFPLTPGNDGLHHDDIDVNMDEDFNWADWGQSLMETSGAGIGGVWSSHGM